MMKQEQHQQQHQQQHDNHLLMNTMSAEASGEKTLKNDA
jgi:hypothetical protein